jgi:hypothetical protein
MPWILFKERFDFFATPKCVLAYKAGKKYLVVRRCADEAIKAGKAEYTERPERQRANASGRSKI